MEESSSSKKALTLEEEQSRNKELGQEESEEEDFYYLENDEDFQKAMETGAKRQNQVNSWMKLLGMQLLKELSDPRKHPHHQSQIYLKHPHQKHCQELQDLQKGDILQHQLRNLKELQYPQERLLK
ncbi:hypothetical protein O181_051723 [Austropuccinia psidii MF-1]|uniref:Uncharacterized protein n=1 Tax=Austropuccinia psidii MF-1 TaxID=1389203 RepID=A0A9Q3E466_9BASI|nr:hypothetical protein [Austropuccinia psidii MF-1]